MLGRVAVPGNVANLGTQTLDPSASALKPFDPSVAEFMYAGKKYKIIEA